MLEALPAYKVRPSPDTIPDRWMTGTQNHEGIAGVAAAIDYLASLGTGATRRQRLVSAMTAIREYETVLTRKLLAGLAAMPSYRVWGLTQEADLPRRAQPYRSPTTAWTPRRSPAGSRSARFTSGRATSTRWNWPNAWASKARGGFVRLGLVHYNTPEEVERLLAAVNDL